jgi:subtilisin-like proprotein convertase family protein
MRSPKLTLIALAVLCAGLAQAQVYSTNTYSSGTLNTTIPDANPVGITKVAGLSGMNGAIVSVAVSLDITGGFNGDLYAFLAGPSGSTAILLNRVGLTAGNPIGYGDAGFTNFTLVDTGTDIHTYQSGSYTLSGGKLTGVWQADGRNINPQSGGAAFDAASTANGLNVFNNDFTPNGNWTLFLADVSGGNQSTLVSWGLTIVTVPEPQTWAMIAGGVGMLFVLRRRTSR